MIRIDGLSKTFQGERVLESFDLDIPEGLVTVLVGPSGCGKTTFLRILGGLMEGDSGEVVYAKRGGEAPEIRMVFQEDRLLPWATVRENLLLADTSDEAEIEERVEELLAMTGMTEAAAKYPRQLSGGMKKRVALARAFVPESDILLLDEPFQALDWSMKLSLMTSFSRIWAQRPGTSVLVSHDIQEAALLGDLIHILDAGPMRILRTIRNTVPRDQRRLYADPVLKIEQEIFRALMKA